MLDVCHLLFNYCNCFEFSPLPSGETKGSCKTALAVNFQFPSTLLLKPATVAQKKWYTKSFFVGPHFAALQPCTSLLVNLDWGHRYLRCSFRGHLLRRREGGTQNGGCSHRCPRMSRDRLWLVRGDRISGKTVSAGSTMRTLENHGKIGPPKIER